VAIVIIAGEVKASACLPFEAHLSSFSSSPECSSLVCEKLQQWQGPRRAYHPKFDAVAAQH